MCIWSELLRGMLVTASHIGDGQAELDSLLSSAVGGRMMGTRGLPLHSKHVLTFAQEVHRGRPGGQRMQMHRKVLLSLLIRFAEWCKGLS